MQQIFKEIAAIFSVSAIRYFILAGIPFYLCYKVFGKRLGAAKIQNKNVGKLDFKRDILHSMQMTLVSAVIGYLILNTHFINYTRVYTSKAGYPGWWIPVSLFLCLVLHDTYFYWMHRLMHHKRIFKYAHLVHHKSTNPSPWTSYSFHFLEACTESAILLVIVMIIPVQAVTIILFVIVGFIINVYGHLGYEIVPKGFRNTIFFEILNTSVHHNLHHSKFKGNYGLYFRIWDRLLKTEHPDYVKEFDRIQRSRFAAEEQKPEARTQNKSLEAV